MSQIKCFGKWNLERRKVFSKQFLKQQKHSNITERESVLKIEISYAAANTTTKT